MRWLLWCFCLLAESYETINHKKMVWSRKFRLTRVSATRLETILILNEPKSNVQHLPDDIAYGVRTENQSCYGNLDWISWLNWCETAFCLHDILPNSFGEQTPQLAVYKVVFRSDCMWVVGTVVLFSFCLHNRHRQFEFHWKVSNWSHAVILKFLFEALALLRSQFLTNMAWAVIVRQCLQIRLWILIFETLLIRHL